jgi:hypothetical protein
MVAMSTFEVGTRLKKFNAEYLNIVQVILKGGFFSIKWYTLHGSHGKYFDTMMITNESL